MRPRASLLQSEGGVSFKKMQEQKNKNAKIQKLYRNMQEENRAGRIMQGNMQKNNHCVRNQKRNFYRKKNGKIL